MSAKSHAKVIDTLIAKGYLERSYPLPSSVFEPALQAALDAAPTKAAGDSEVGVPAPRQEQGLLIAAEFGFRCGEKGWNLERTLQEAAKLTDGASVPNWRSLNKTISELIAHRSLILRALENLVCVTKQIIPIHMRTECPDLEAAYVEAERVTKEYPTAVGAPAPQAQPETEPSVPVSELLKLHDYSQREVSKSAGREGFDRLVLRDDILAIVKKAKSALTGGDPAPPSPQKLAERIVHDFRIRGWLTNYIENRPVEELLMELLAASSPSTPPHQETT